MVTACVERSERSGRYRAEDWAGVLDAVESGQTVTVRYADPSDRESKRVSVAIRARQRGFRVQCRHNERVLAIRYAGPLSGAGPAARAVRSAAPAAPRAAGALLDEVLGRIAAQWDAAERRRRSMGSSPLERVRGCAVCEVPVVTATREGLARCMTCGACVALRYLVLANFHCGRRTGEGSEGWLLCAGCLSLTPHKLLF